MPTRKQLTKYFVVNPGSYTNSQYLAGRLGNLTIKFMTLIQPSQVRAAKRLWNSIKRYPTRSRFALFHFWHLIHIGVIDFHRRSDLEAFCILLNSYPSFRRVFIDLVLSDNQGNAEAVKDEKALELPIHLTEDIDLAGLSLQKEESENDAVGKIKEWLKDPVIMTRFVDRCSHWLVSLNVDILHHLLKENHAAVRFLNPDSFGLPYAHSALVLQKRYESEEKVAGLLTRDVSNVPEELRQRVEQYYFATVLKFALEYQPILLKGILRDVVVDYPQELSPQLKIVHDRLFGNEVNLYLAEFLSGRLYKTKDSDHEHHHHHSNETVHSDENSKTFKLFEILCGEKHSYLIAGQKFTQRLTKLLQIRGNPLAFVINLFNLKAPRPNVINFFFNNISTLLPIIATSLDRNGIIALNDLMSREFLFEDKSTTMTHVYNMRFQKLLALLAERKLSIRERADVFAEIRANLENDVIRSFLVVDTTHVELLLNDSDYGKNFAPIVTKSISQMHVSDKFNVCDDRGYLTAEKNITASESLQAYVESLDEKKLADAYLLATTYWEKINPRTRSKLNKFLNWLNKILIGVLESRFLQEENKLSEAHPVFEARFAYELTEKEKSFDAFLVEFAKAHWVENLKNDFAFGELISSFLDGADIVELMDLTKSYRQGEDNHFKQVVMRSPYLKARLLDSIAIEDPAHSLDILFLLMEDEALIKEYVQDEQFRSLMAKILQHNDGFDLKFMSEIADIDVRLFVEMVDDQFDNFKAWFLENYSPESLSLILRAGHRGFCARVLPVLHEKDPEVIRSLVRNQSSEFLRACKEQPELVQFILEQSDDVRKIFYEKYFHLIAAIYERSEGEIDFDLSDEVKEEIRDQVFNMTVKLADLDAANEEAENKEIGEIRMLQDVLSSMFQYAPKEFFDDVEETELWALYKHIEVPSALFDKEFVQSHQNAMVQLFCHHILEINIEYWPVIFNNKEDLEFVFVYLDENAQKAVVDRVRNLPSKTMCKQLAALNSPTLKEFFKIHEGYNAYAQLRKNHKKLLRGEIVESEGFNEENNCSASLSS